MIVVVENDFQVVFLGLGEVGSEAVASIEDAISVMGLLRRRGRRGRSFPFRAHQCCDCVILACIYLVVWEDLHALRGEADEAGWAVPAISSSVMASCVVSSAIAILGEESRLPSGDSWYSIWALLLELEVMHVYHEKGIDWLNFVPFTSNKYT